MHVHTAVSRLLLPALMLLASRVAPGQCPDWAPGFGSDGTSDAVWTLAVYDDGNGPALHAGGEFAAAGTVQANRVARWSGSEWTALSGPGSGAGGIGLTGLTFVLAKASTVYDDGSGPALVVGGSFKKAGNVTVNHVARWDGSGWSALGGGVGGANPSVAALLEHDDGSGSALYAGGVFGSAGPVAARNLARWDGLQWTPVGSQGPGAFVNCLAEYDDGNGPALYAGGAFTSVDGVPASHVARWDGTAWTPLGTGTDGLVFSMAVHDDGTGAGPRLFVGGTFTTAGGVAAQNVASWDGSVWSPVGSGFDGRVEALLGFDPGSGPVLVAGGSFDNAGGSPVASIASWNGASWAGIGGGTDGPVRALSALDDGQGPRLLAGGSFGEAGGQPADNVACWDGLAWSALGAGNGLDPTVRAMTLHDDGGGAALYAASGFSPASVERWQGTEWVRVGEVFVHVLENFAQIEALASLDLGAGPELLAGGSFQSVGGQPAVGAARWTGSAWVELGGGVAGGVNAFELFDDGTGAGPALVVGGSFTSAGGVTAASIASWNGSAWSPLGAGINGTVEVMKVFDDGSGPALYVGGTLNPVGNTTIRNIARWDGVSWTAVAGGLSNTVQALAVHDEGQGPRLFAGGKFTFSGGSPATLNRLARWDGSAWTKLGPGTNAGVRALAAFDDGLGEALFATGVFSKTGNKSIDGIARWDGSAWAPLGKGLDTGGFCLQPYDDPLLGPGLFVGGGFQLAGGVPSVSVARWAALPGCGPRSYCTAGTSASGCQALLSAAGTSSATAPSGFVLSAAGVEGAKDGLFFFGTNGRQANPWGNGSSYQCVVPPVKRGGLLTGLGTAGACDGSFAQDLNQLWTASPAKNPGAGTTVQAQLWYRDPQNTSNQTTSLSDATEFDLGP